MSPAPTADVAAIEHTLNVMCEGVVEIRVLNGYGVSSGYFDRNHLGAAAATIAARYSKGTAGIYFTPNPPAAALLARASNRIVDGAKITTSDADIERRQWLLIDLDPRRPSGVSSSDAEHESALTRAQVIVAYLRGQGWPAPIVADSGNGAHICFRIDLPNDDASRDLMKNVLAALDLHFSDNVVQIDQTTFNAARIWKTYGTVACKGDSTQARPHRLSRMLNDGINPDTVSREQLEALAAQAPQAAASAPGARFDLQAFINRHSVPVEPAAAWNGGLRWVFPVCPFDQTHSNRSAVLYQMPSGALGFRCHHNGCTGKSWADLRSLFEPQGFLPDGEKKARRVSSGQEQQKRTNQAVALIEELSPRCRFFQHDGKPYATYAVGDHRETWPLESTAFRRFAGATYYQNRGGVPSSENLKAAINVLSARALAGENIPVYLRTSGQVDGCAYIDVGDPEWNVIKVAPEGWSVITSAACPARFRRSKSTLALTIPSHGSDIRELRPFVNLGESDDAGFLLLVCFMVAVLLGVAPYPILLMIAEHGATKSTQLKILRRLLDPSALPVRSLPKEPRDFAVAAENNPVIAYDNVSSLPAWLSDLMCGASTGGGFGVRQLHSDAEEQIFNYRRPQAITSIKECANAPDFLDRALALTLPHIKKREVEKAFWARFDKAAPQILGALLDGAVYALAYPVEAEAIKDLPRMADFAECACAAAPGFGWTADDFLAAYRENAAAGNANVLENSLVAQYLPCPWEGTASELLEFLELKAPEQVRKHKRWPSDGRLLSNHLRTIVGNLRDDRGIEITFEKPSHSRRVITIANCENEKNVNNNEAEISWPCRKGAGCPCEWCHKPGVLRCGECQKAGY